MKNIIIKSLIIGLVFIVMAGSATATWVTTHPISAGAYTEWLCSSNCSNSTHYSVVDENYSAPNFNDYLSGPGPNNLIETFRFGAVSIPAGKHVDGVLFQYWARTVSNGSQFKPVYRQNGNLTYGPFYFSVNDVWSKHSILYIKNPVTEQNWTNAEVLNLEGGMTGLGNLNTIQISTVQVNVSYS